MPNLGKTVSLSQETEESFDNEVYQKFLKRSARGFIVEFLRHDRDNVPNLNDKEKWSWQKKEMELHSRPGVFHATATMKWLLQHNINEAESLKILGTIIQQSAEVFNREYPLIEQDFTGKKASIPLRYADRIVEDAQKAVKTASTKGI